VVYGVQPDRLLVFVPEYHIRGSIRLCDAKGQPLPPPADAEAEAAGSGSDAFALAARRQLRLETGASLSFPMQFIAHLRLSAAVTLAAKISAGCVCCCCRTEVSSQDHIHAGDGCTRILDNDDRVLLDVRAPQRVWLRLSADASRAHGPALRLQLLADAHPAAVAAAAKEAAAAEAPGGSSRAAAAAAAARGRKPGITGDAALAVAQGGSSAAQQAVPGPANAMEDVFPWLADEGPNSVPAAAGGATGGAASDASQQQQQQLKATAPKQQGNTSNSKGGRNKQPRAQTGSPPAAAASLAQALQRALAMALADAKPLAPIVVTPFPGAHTRVQLQPTKIWEAQAGCNLQLLNVCERT
jgi:hypothetical protein